MMLNTRLARWSFSLLLIVIATLLKLALRATLGEIASPFLLYIPAIVVASWYSRMSGAVIATFCSTAAICFFFLDRVASTGVGVLAIIVHLVIFILVGLLIGGITEALHRQKDRAEEAHRALVKTGAAERQQSQWLQTILSSMGDGVVATDKSGRIMFVNPVSEALTGWPQQEAQNRSLEEVFKVVATQGGFQEGRPISISLDKSSDPESSTFYVLIDRKGREIPVEYNVAPIRGADGGIVGSVLVFRDVSERKKGRETLHRLAAIVGSSDDAIIGKTLDGVILSWNSGAERIYGYSAAEVIGRHITILTPPDRLDEIRGILEKLRRGERIDHFQTVRITRDGRQIDVSLAISPIRDISGAIVGAATIARDITESKRLAFEAESHKQRLNNIVATVPGVVWEAWGHPDQSSQRIEFVSDYVETLLGYSREEWLGTPNFWLTIVHPDDKERAAREAAEIFSNKKGGAIQFRWLAKDGRVLWVESQSVVICDESGGPIGMRGVTMDITAHKKSEQAQRFLAEASTLLSSSLDYETILESIARLAVPTLADWCAVDVVDDDRNFRRLAAAHVDDEKLELANELHWRYPPHPDAASGVIWVLRTGKPEHIKEISPQTLIDSARDQEHLAMLREFAPKSSVIVPMIARGRTVGAITFVMAESGRSYDDADLQFLTDLARRASLAFDNALLYREAQDAINIREKAVVLHRSVEERLTLLAEASSTLMSSPKLEEVLPAILTLSHQLISADAYAVWRGFDAEHEWRIVSSSGLSEKFTRVPVSTASSNWRMPRTVMTIEKLSEEPRLELRRDLHGEEGLESLLVVPLPVQGGFSGTLAFYYRTQRQFSETEIRVATALGNLAAAAIGSAELYEEQLRLRAEAEQSNRIKDEFLATLSHELRTPLNAILGWARMLRSGSLDEQTLSRAMETIERNARAQAQLIEDLLDVSRIITGKLRLRDKPVRLSSVIEASVDVIRPAAQAKEIHLEILDTTRESFVSGDPDRLQQIIWNLLSNAVKFTPRGGRVTVRTERVDSLIQIAVTDTGQGISRAFLSYVFDRFRQADSSITRQHGGLGLGLAIVRHLVELHGGTVSAHSEGEGQGATFTVSLPLLIGPAREPIPDNEGQIQNEQADLSMRLTSDSLSGLTALVIDDDRDAQELISAVLNAHGAKVVIASSAKEGLEALRSSGPDVLISDIEMPEEDGYTLIRKVRAMSAGEGGSVPAIALTAHARREDRSRAIVAGYQSHVPKPFDPARLVSEIVNLALPSRSAKAR